MKYSKIFIILVATSTLVACTPTVSDADLQNAIEQVVETSVANTAPTETHIAMINAANAELEKVQSQLDAANLVLTAQSNQLATMQEQIDFIQLALTPTITPVPSVTVTITPLPTPTPSLLPDDQKLVYAIRQTGLYTYTEKNDSGYPVMNKTDPIVRYEEGDWIIVLSALVQADGGTLFYEVVSPYGGGNFVDITHVRDY